MIENIYIILFLVVIAVVGFCIKKFYYKSSGFYNLVNEKFKNKISYVDYIALTKTRDPILYFELKQLYKRKNNNVSEEDVTKIQNKYKT